MWQLDTELGPELRRVVSGAKRGRGKFQAAAGPELGTRKRRNEPDWTAKGLGGGGRGAGPRLRRPGGGGADSRPKPTAGPNRPRVAACELPGLFFLPSLTGFPNLSAPPPDSRSLCRRVSSLFVVCVRVRSFFPAPVSPGLIIPQGFSVRDVSA